MGACSTTLHFSESARTLSQSKGWLSPYPLSSTWSGHIHGRGLRSTLHCFCAISDWQILTFWGTSFHPHSHTGPYYHSLFKEASLSFAVAKITGREVSVVCYQGFPNLSTSLSSGCSGKFGNWDILNSRLVIQLSKAASWSFIFTLGYDSPSSSVPPREVRLYLFINSCKRFMGQRLPFLN